MTFEVVVGAGAGPIRLGMARSELVRALASFSDDAPVGCDVAAAEEETIFSAANAVRVYLKHGTVVAMEFAGPGRDGQFLGGAPDVAVRYQGVDLFRTPAEELIEFLSNETDVVLGDEATYNYPTLGLKLWRGDGPDDDERWPEYFESIFIREPLGDPRH